MKTGYSSTISAFIFSMLLISCGTASDETSGEEAEAVTPVTVTNVTSGPMEETVEFNAVSVFQKKIAVKATVTGYIDEVNATLGNNVGMNQQLFVIRTKESSALHNAGVDSLLGFSGMIRINSQKAGVITIVDHQKGDYVQDGDELAVIADRSSLVFLLQVPFGMSNSIRTGSACEIVLPGDSILKGRVTGSLPEVDAVSQTQQFVVQALNGGAIPENLIAKIRVIKNVKENTIIVPMNALQSDEAQTEFWVMKVINDSTAVKVPVTTGIQSETMTEILEPLFTVSDRIVVDGSYGLADTAKISIEKR